jgi:hypothetical protein
MKKALVNYEERFCHALRRIKAYMTTAQLRRHSERKYGLSYEEALEMAYENVLGEAQAALRGYRPPSAIDTAVNDQMRDLGDQVKDLAHKLEDQ